MKVRNNLIAEFAWTGMLVGVAIPVAWYIVTGMTISVPTIAEVVVVGGALGAGAGALLEVCYRYFIRRMRRR